MKKEFFLVRGGTPVSAVYYPAGCEKVIKRAAEEFIAASEKITGVRLTVREFTNVKNIAPNSVVLSSFEFIPGRLFTEDRKALAKTDGFCVRNSGGSVYICSHFERGVFFGAHDFLERNADILWTRGNGDFGCSYIESPDLRVTDADYVSKPAFYVRGWNTCGEGGQGDKLDRDTMLCFAKNKINAKCFVYDPAYADYGMQACGTHIDEIHSIEEYRESNPEYFMVGFDGKPKPARYESYINYYSRGAARIVAEKIIVYFDRNPAALKNSINLGIPDDPYFVMRENGLPLSEMPFTSDDGNTVRREEKNYKSTVYFNYLNRVISMVKQRYPHARFSTLAYLYAQEVPATRIDENLTVAVAPILTNDRYDYTEDTAAATKEIAETIRGWCKKTADVFVYNYWQSFKGEVYSRPNIGVVQRVLKWYRELGVKGIIPEGKIDTPAALGGCPHFDMNELYCWQTHRLMYDPDDNTKESEKRFCRIVYGEAADDMFEYYGLIREGWDKVAGYVFYATGADVYIGQFLIKAGVSGGAIKALRRALKKRLSDKQRRKIQAIYDTILTQVERYSGLEDEEAAAVYCPAGTEVILSREMLALEENPLSVWTKAGRLNVFKDIDTLAPYDTDAKFCVRLLWDESYLYFGFRIFDDSIASFQGDTYGETPPALFRKNGEAAESYTETYVGGNILNMSRYFGYISGFLSGKERQVYLNDGVPHKIETPGDFREAFYVYADDDPKKSYCFHVQAISFRNLGVTVETAAPYGSFVYYTDRYGRAGWKGNGLWSKQNFCEIKLLK